MAASTVIKNFTDGVIALADGTGTPVTLTVPFTNGDLNASGLAQQLNEVTAYETRGTFNTLRHTNRTYPSGSFTAQFADLTDGTDNTLVDFLLKQGSYSANLSTLGTNADVYTVNVQLTIEGTDHGDSADHVLTMNDCYCTVDISEGDPNSVTVNFTVYGSVVMT